MVSFDVYSLHYGTQAVTNLRLQSLIGNADWKQCVSNPISNPDWKLDWKRCVINPIANPDWKLDWKRTFSNPFPNPD